MQRGWQLMADIGQQACLDPVGFFGGQARLMNLVDQLRALQCAADIPAQHLVDRRVARTDLKQGIAELLLVKEEWLKYHAEAPLLRQQIGGNQPSRRTVLSPWLQAEPAVFGIGQDQARRASWYGRVFIECEIAARDAEPRQMLSQHVGERREIERCDQRLANLAQARHVPVGLQLPVPLDALGDLADQHTGLPKETFGTLPRWHVELGEQTAA